MERALLRICSKGVIASVEGRTGEGTEGCVLPTGLYVGSQLLVSPALSLTRVKAGMPGPKGSSLKRTSKLPGRLLVSMLVT